MIAFVDVDGVCADLLSRWVGHLNTKFGRDVKVEDIVKWDLHEFYPDVPTKCIYEPLKYDWFYKDVQPIADALAGVNGLRARGYDVVFATSSNKVSCGAKWEWLASHGFLLKPENDHSKEIIFVSDKSLLRGDLLIDDGPHNLEHFVGKRIMFDAPYNQDVDMPRAKSWKDVIALIEPAK